MALSSLGGDGLIVARTWTELKPRSGDQPGASTSARLAALDTRIASVVTLAFPEGTGCGQATAAPRPPPRPKPAGIPVRAPGSAGKGRPPAPEPPQGRQAPEPSLRRRPASWPGRSQ